MFLYEKLNQLISCYSNEHVRNKIADAFLFGANAHEQQARSSGEPYFTHPVAVACTLAEMRLDENTIIAALLHDVVEDTDITSEDIANRFGVTAAKLVDGVTKLKQIQFNTKAEAQAENFRKMMLAMVDDIRVIIIKLADRLHNMSTLGPLKPEKRNRIALETLEIYAPIAHRLGMHHFKNEFENLAFQALYPFRYNVLLSRLKQAQGNRKKLFTKIHQSLIKHLRKENISPEHISGREKRIFSIYRKMQYRNIAFSEIMDVYAYRIIAESKRHCYYILGALHEIYRPIPGKFKDYIAMPKANAYQSLHTTLFGPYGVPIEIQIRTEEMDYTAERGVAAHWIYKSDDLDNEKSQRWIERLANIQKTTMSSLEFIESVKIDIFPDDVYVFTPSGDIVELPKGSTVVDFAYYIHTGIGNSCIAAKINRRIVPLSQQLKHGETVEILTSSTAHPSPNWLKFCQTNRAKTAIRAFINNQEHEQAYNLGRQLLKQVLKRGKVKLEDVPEGIFNSLCKKLKITSFKKILVDIGYGELDLSIIASTLYKVIQQHNSDNENANANLSPDEKQTDGLSINVPNRYTTSLAKCCYPIPGDNVVGILIPKVGLEIHKIHCSKLQDRRILQRNPKLAVDIDWEEYKLPSFASKLLVEAANSPGTIAELAGTINYRKASIQQIHIDEAEQSYGIISIIVAVNNREHLAKIIRSLRNLKVVYKVSRFTE